MFKLAKPVNFSKFKKTIAPICIADNTFNSKNLTGRIALMAGWGNTSPTGRKATALNQVKLPIVSEESCKATYGNSVAKIDDKVICAGGKVGKDACSGDSGGPLSVWTERKHIQVGIAAFVGNECAAGSELNSY